MYNGLWSLSYKKNPTCGAPAPLSDGLTWIGKIKLNKLLLIFWYILLNLFDKLRVNVYNSVDDIFYIAALSVVEIKVQ